MIQKDKKSQWEKMKLNYKITQKRNINMQANTYINTFTNTQANMLLLPLWRYVKMQRTFIFFFTDACNTESCVII